MELVFLMVVLKIPIVYLCVVIYRAIKAVPENEPGEPVLVRVRPRPRPPRPHGGPARAYARTRAGSIAGKAGAARRKTEGRLRRPSGRTARTRADRVSRG